VDDTCTDQTCTWLLLTLKYLPLRGTEALISTYEKSVSSVGGHEVTTCFTSVSAAHCFPVRSFLRPSKETENCRRRAVNLVAALGLWCMDHPHCSACRSPTHSACYRNVLQHHCSKQRVPGDAHSALSILESQLKRISGGYVVAMGHAVAQLLEALRYVPEGHGFDSRLGHWNFSMT
jgi:hypothetical protein